MSSIEMMQAVFTKQKGLATQNIAPSLENRKASLQKLLNWMKSEELQIQAAIQADFGNRSAHETLIAEIMTSCEDIKSTLKHLKSWMRDEHVSVPFWQMPGKAKIIRQPLGVIGIIVPWNYPLFLAMSPLVAAIASGNRVMIKMSEFTPNFSDFFQKKIAQLFPEEQITVITGGADVAREFSSLAFDHILFTGSTSVGRHVMMAAAKNLTPVTLELGGKSPTLIGANYPLNDAADKITFGKLCNAGQTCIAPDYVLIPRQKVNELIDELKKSVKKMYPSLESNVDYTSIINEGQKTRLQGYINEAQNSSTNQIIPLHNEVLEASSKKLQPMAILGSPQLKAFQDEIFGPILPIVPYDTLSDAIKYINDRPKPLALYLLSHDSNETSQVLQHTQSGGVTINDMFHHLLSHNLPFGGVGPSGMGHYHGKYGFDTFSKLKSVFTQSRFSSGKLLYPPYKNLHKKIMHFIMG
jgi:coniferyl-aldehyde dehydrogenase